MEKEARNCQNCKNDFIIEPDDFAFYEKMKVPAPTFCPECRMIRRMMWRNEITLYKRDCDLCGKSIITIYAKDSPYAVYCRDCWISDKWDAKIYGIEYDWESNFFVQFRKLLEKVPLVSADIKGTMVNSEYGNYNANCKNCYLCFATAISEDCSYCSDSQDLKQCLDSTHLRGGEICYEAVDSEINYSCAFINRTRQSVNSSFLFGCSGADNCFMSTNLRNKNYVFRNEQLSADEYRLEIKNIELGSFKQIQKLKEEFSELKASVLHKYAEIKNAFDATGDNITNSKNVRHSFDVIDSENVKYSSRVLKGCKDIYDCHGIIFGELVYEGFGCGMSPRNNLFSFSVDVSRNLKYCATCRDCLDCFGCIGLKNQQYCIFNRQYSKEEYEILVPKIIQHMNNMPYIDKKGRVYKYGEFFPAEFSLFAYNETIAQEHFALTKEQAEEQGYKWRENDAKNYKIDLKSKDLPDHIKDADESILGKIIECVHKGECKEQCTQAFKIIKEELQFYKKLNLPLPRLCPNCRHYERLSQRNPARLWHRHCMKQGCTNEFETSYAPDRPEIVYCESCYNAEVA